MLVWKCGDDCTKPFCAISCTWHDQIGPQVDVESRVTVLYSPASILGSAGLALAIQKRMQRVTRQKISARLA